MRNHLTELIACALLASQTGNAMAMVGADTTTSAGEAPAPGDIIPAFDAQSLGGSVQRVDFPKGSHTVLLFFLSSCSVCHRMIPEWNRAFERRPPALQVLGVLLDKEPPGFFLLTPVAFPVVRAPSREFLQKHRIQHAPVTLRVGPGGKVEDVGVGIVDPIRLGEIFRP